MLVLLVPILVLLIALLKPFMCFLTFFECSLSSSKTLMDLEGFFVIWMFSLVALQTLIWEKQLVKESNTNRIPFNYQFSKSKAKCTKLIFKLVQWAYWRACSKQKLVFLYCDSCSSFWSCIFCFSSADITVKRALTVASQQSLLVFDNYVASF